MRLLAFIGTLIPSFLCAQVFTEVSVDQGIFHMYLGGEYGGGVSFYDVNKDGWDDLTLCNSGQPVLLYLNQEGDFQEPIVVAPNTGEAKSITWVDYDNDGDADLFVTRKHGNWSLYRNDGDLTNMVDVTVESGLPLTNDETYAGTWGDINRDGHLDLYVANYNSDGTTNKLFINNGDGTFTDATSSSAASDGSLYSFLGFFIDVNFDLWPDLFVVNDRQSASNNLYINNEGVFQQVTDQVGLYDGFFAMNASAADYDHDGHMDIYVSNNPFGNRLYKQANDFTYTDVAQQVGVSVFDHSWSAQWIDYDNDTFEDLHVACSPFWQQPGQNRFFKNQGDGTFADYTIQAGFETDKGWSHSTAAGDFNNDGFFDLFVVNDAPYGSKLWQAEPNDNHYLKVTLQGTASNRDGIGSWVLAYTNGTKLMRYTHCGEGYMTQNSQTEIFGLAQTETLDSLIIQWPSGHIDQYYDLPTSSTQYLIEGLSQSAGLSASQNTICEGDSILLIPELGEIYNWSTGVTTSSPIYIDSPGTYSFTTHNQFGVPIYSDTLVIAAGEPIDFSLTLTHPTCLDSDDGSIEVQSDVDFELTLNGLTAGWVTNNLPPGTYELYLHPTEGCPNSTSVQLIQPADLQGAVVPGQIACFGETTQVNYAVFGGNGSVTPDWGEFDPSALSAGDYYLILSDENGCSINLPFTITQPSPLVAVISQVNQDLIGEAFGGTPPYTFQWSLNSQVVSNEAEFTPSIQGSYELTVTDSNGCATDDDITFIPSNVSIHARTSIELYPNPVIEQLFISLGGLQCNDLFIYNGTGSKVLALQTPNANQLIIETAHFAPGVYFVVIRLQDGNVQRLQFIKG